MKIKKNPSNDLIPKYYTTFGRCFNVDDAPARGKKVMMYKLVDRSHKLFNSQTFYCTDIDKLNSFHNIYFKGYDMEIISPDDAYRNVPFCTDNNDEIWYIDDGKNARVGDIH